MRVYPPVNKQTAQIVKSKKKKKNVMNKKRRKGNVIVLRRVNKGNV
jgi:hypothetical protein